MKIRPIKSLVKSCISVMGYQLVRKSNNFDFQSFPTELSKDDRSIFDYVVENSLSMSTRERLYSTLLACRHVVEAKIPGAFVECGVWRGGNSIIAADVFRRLDPQRRIHLYDTFAGMTAPTAIDINLDGMSASQKFQATAREDHNEWAFSPLEEVQANFSRRGLLNDNVSFVRGDVLETLRQPENLPAVISVLRLDTDWYESTRAELETLFPMLSDGGVLIIDDYGHWSGARKAVDEFFSTRRRPLLQYVDYTARMGVKSERISP
jgi:hypothetical protein